MDDDYDDKPACDNCGYPAELEQYQSPIETGAFDSLCHICANTHLAKALHYPRHVDDPQLYQAIAYIGNMIVDEIRKAGK